MALAVAARAEMVAPIANMLEAAVAAGNLNEPVPAPTSVLVDDTPRPRSAEQGGTAREGRHQDRHVAPGACRSHLHPSKHRGTGPQQHRVDRTPVRPRWRSGPAGMGGLGYRGHRRRPRAVGSLDRGSQRVQGDRRAGLFGRGGRHLWPGGVPTGPVLSGPVQAVGTGPPDRHLGHRRGRRL